MEIKNLNKKGGETIENIFIIMILCVAIFAGCYLFWAESVGYNSGSIPSQYSEMYGNLTARQVIVDTKAKEVRDAITEIEEDPNIQTGFKGFVKALQLIPAVITTGIGTFFDFLSPFNMFPGWFNAFILTSIIVFIVFAVMRAIGGRTQI